MSVEINEKEDRILPGYIVFEGLDGAGTTTQSLLLSEKMKLAGVPVWPTFEPTSGETGLLIRKILGGTLQCHPGTLAALFVADRYEHLYGKGGIISRLEKGFRVIGDRYLFSSLAYQSLDVDFEHVYEINSSFPLPEYLFFLDIEPEECEKRMTRRESRELFENLAMQRRVQELYERTLELYRDRGMKMYRFNGLLPKEDLAENIWSILSGGR
jgi:dTMP kinase